MLPVDKDAKLPLSETLIYEAIDKQQARISSPVPFRANTMRFEVPPGKYIVLPFTVESNQDLKFMLRLFSEMPANLKLVDWFLFLQELKL